MIRWFLSSTVATCDGIQGLYFGSFNTETKGDK